MTIGDCKKFLGLDIRPGAELPEEFKHLGGASVEIWRRQVLKRLRELAASKTAVKAAWKDNLDFVTPFLGVAKEIGNRKEPPIKVTTDPVEIMGHVTPKSDIMGELRRERAKQEQQAMEDQAAIASLVVDAVNNAVPMIEGYFPKGVEAGQRIKNVPLPWGGRGDMVISMIMGAGCNADTVLARAQIHNIVPGQEEELHPEIAGHGLTWPDQEETEAKSAYVKQTCDNSWCPRCNENNIVLLAHNGLLDRDGQELSEKAMSDKTPSFYICKCGYIAQVGVGPVEEG